MADRTVVAGSLGITAGQMKDFWRQVGDGSLTGYHMQAMLEHRDPFSFERNEHGHIVVTVNGLDLTGAQEIQRFEKAGDRFSKWAKSCLLSTKPDSYDANHRLVAGQVYRFALMPTAEIEVPADRTTENLRTRGVELYGYHKPLGGAIPRVRERVSYTQMEEMGFSYIAAPHDPIEDSDGDPSVLRARRGGDGRWVGADVGRPGHHWDDYGAFAFLVPASVPLAPAA